MYQVEYKFQVMFAKLAMLFFYTRVFRVDKGFVFRTRCFMVFIVVASVAFGLANIFACQ